MRKNKTGTAQKLIYPASLVQDISLFSWLDTESELRQSLHQMYELEAIVQEIYTSKKNARFETYKKNKGSENQNSLWNMREMRIPAQSFFPFVLYIFGSFVVQNEITHRPKKNYIKEHTHTRIYPLCE